MTQDRAQRRSDNPRFPDPASRAVTPRLRPLLIAVGALAGILGANSLYLAAITLAEHSSGRVYQNYFYQWMFLVHVAVGLLATAPVVAFLLFHVRAARRRPNRLARRVGYALGAAVLAVLITGIALLRVGGVELRHPAVRSAVWWLHAIAPLAAAWLYVLHRLAGPPLAWRRVGQWAIGVAALVLLAVGAHVAGSSGGDTPEQAFAPSLVRTANGGTIPASSLMIDGYCRECHADVYQGWFHSAHRFSSFNNPFYAFSVLETRRVALARDGSVQASRWCAGCHDPVPLLSGAFDREDFDPDRDPSAHAGITCVACHAITAVNSRRGNADYTIEAPQHYPFFGSDGALGALNRQLIRARPSLHRRTFLKPVHRSAEFCSACHKVHIPMEVNRYKEFLRGQNHFDSFILSGASGHGARSFYYPDRAQARCSGCHMPLLVSSDFGARDFDGSGRLAVHDHLFPAANTGLAHVRGDAATVAAHQAFLRDAMRIDLFGIKAGGTIDGELTAPLRPRVPALVPGRTYLLEVVVRSLKVGHHFTQGTADSNEVWVEVRAASAGRRIGASGSIDDGGTVDPWSHFLNVYMLDRHGNRVDRRNVQDIFVPLYDHQVAPGSAQVVHYRLDVPRDAAGPVEVEVALQYRKFDRRFTALALGDDFPATLPVTTLARDRVVFPLAGAAEVTAATHAVPAWERWNDYGIGLLLEGSSGSEKGELRQAIEAFTEVERLGRFDGPLNLARTYHKEGRLDDAAGALDRARAAGAPPWTVAWLTGLVNKENGQLDAAIANFREALGATSPELRARGFDFSTDYEVINELGQTLFERARRERGPRNAGTRRAFLLEAAGAFERTLSLDPENVTAHYVLALIHEELGDADRAEQHRRQHARYKPDENARDRAIATHRLANPAANHAAQSVVIYPLAPGHR